MKHDARGTDASFLSTPGYSGAAKRYFANCLITAPPAPPRIWERV